MDYLDIIRTYELSEKTQNSLASIAKTTIEDLSLFSFREQYSLIAGLVDRFNIPYNEKKAFSLESTFFSRILGVKDEPFSDQDNEQGISVNETFDLLRLVLDRTNFRILRQLFPKVSKKLRLDISEDKIWDQAEQINQRLEQFIKAFEYQGDLIIPKRPIIHIEFNPLHVKLGYRKFYGDPLKYLRDHPEIYGGKGRAQLSIYDKSLYNCLIKAGQMDQAIPELKQKSARLSEEQKLVIFQAYDTYDGNINQAAKDLPFSSTTIRRWWLKKGFELRKPGWQKD